MGGIGPGPDIGKALLQLRNVPLGRGKIIQTPLQALVGQARIRIGQRLRQTQHEPRMAFRPRLAKIRKPGEVPQPAHLPRAGNIRPDGRIFRHPAQHPFVQRMGIMDQGGMAGRLFQAQDQAAQAGEIQRRIAPLQMIDRIETVRLDGLPCGLVKGRAGRCLAELTIGPEPPCPARNLRAFRRRQQAVAAAVEFRARGKHDPVHIQVQPHADRVRGNDIIDLAGLVELDLRIARARAERPHDDGRPALLAAQQLANRIDLIGAERDDGRPFRQLCDLGMADIAQLGKALARLGLRAELQRPQHTAHRVTAQQQRLVIAAQIEDTVGEDMAPVLVLGQLDLVNRDEIHFQVGRHGFHGTHPIARRRRNNPLLASNQRDMGRALALDHAVIDLARKQAQRQADHAGAESCHPLDGVVRLAGIGGAENGLQGGTHRRCVAGLPMKVKLRVQSAHLLCSQTDQSGGKQPLFMPSAIRSMT